MFCTEWLLRNPVLSQSGEMQASELETLALLGQGEEAQMSPNFFERDQLENFSLPFDLELINDDKSRFEFDFYSVLCSCCLYMW